MGSLFCCSVVRVSLPLRKHTQTECMMGVKMLLLVCLLAALQVAALPAAVPGSPYNINDPGFQKAILTAIDSVNSQSGDTFLFKPSDILGAQQQQVTDGLQYTVGLMFSRTVCRNGNGNNNMNFCPFQPKGQLSQTFQCHVEVWMDRSQNRAETRMLFCKPT